MNKTLLACALALAAVLGCCASQLFARGGHGGGHGGHHGGRHSGHHGHHTSHHHDSHHHTGHHHASHHAHHHAHWANHHRPFSRDWYGRHHAWGGGWGWGNPWAVANWGTTAAWLDLATAPEWGGYGPTNTTIYDTDNEYLNQPAGEPVGQTISPQALASQSSAAQALAAEGVSEPGADDKFLPLGVFTLAPENQTEATAMLQLAVSKQGLLRGTYYDLLSDVDHPIRGSVDKQTQRAAWTFGPGGQVTFQTALPVLTEASGPVSVHYENGQTRQWVLARYEQEPSENSAQVDESGDPSEDVDAADDAPNQPAE